jgi:LacI family transcriptional regulator
MQQQNVSFASNMDSKKKPVTIRDVARLARVSIGTVDRALHNRGRVAKKVVQRIRKIIDEVGYKPNIFASRLSRSKVYNFAAVMPVPEQDDGYWESSINGIKKAEKELEHYHIKIRYFFFNRQSIDENLRVYDKICDSSIDGLLIAPVLYQSVRECIERLRSNIPFVFFDTDIPELHPLSFIGQDSFQSGFVCGRLMKTLVHRPGTIAVIITHPDDFHIRRRASGFEEFFKDTKEHRITEFPIFDFGDTRAVFKSIERIFIENEDLEGIFVTNVSTHHIAEYVQANVKDKKIFLIGYDLIEENLRFLNSGVIDFLISQKPEKQGYEGIYALYRHVVLHEPINARIMMPIDIITKENVAYYIENK